MNGEYQAREPLLQKYYHLARNLILQFKDATVVHVSRANNDRADVLSKLASTKKSGQHRTLIQEVLNMPNWDHEDVFKIRPEIANWMTPISDFLVNDVFPENKTKAKKVRRQATSFRWSMVNFLEQGFPPFC